jgi:enamine deaminase RidA (YjgF/YER057c/UK114 family)
MYEDIPLLSDEDRTIYKEWRFAPARRALGLVFISGVVVSRNNGPFNEATRIAFERLRTRLASYGLGFEDVVLINTFHDWNAPEFSGDRWAQFDAFNSVKDEFVGEPYPAWTAVGTSGLIRQEGVVEIQMIAADRSTSHRDT